MKYLIVGPESVEFNDQLPSKEQAMPVNGVWLFQMQSYRYVRMQCFHFWQSCTIKRSWEVSFRFICSQQRSIIKIKMKFAYLKLLLCVLNWVVLIKTRLKLWSRVKWKRKLMYWKCIHLVFKKNYRRNEDGGSIDFNNLDTEDVDFKM
jgi:hypothetical protein